MLISTFDARLQKLVTIEVPDADVSPELSIIEESPTPTIEERVAAVEETLTLLTEVIL